MRSTRAFRFLLVTCLSATFVIAATLLTLAVTPSEKTAPKPSEPAKPSKPAVVRSGPYLKKPIPNGPNSYTGEKFCEDLKVFLMKLIVGEYKSVGRHNAKWDEQAEKFLTDYVSLTTRFGDRRLSAEIVDQGKKLMELGCDDPMVLLCYGELLIETRDTAAATGVLERSIGGFKTSSYHKGYSRRAPIALARLKDTSQTLDPKVKAIYDLALEWTLQSMNDGSFGPKDQRMALCSGIRKGKRGCDLGLKWSELIAEIEKNPPKDPYIYRVVVGEARINAAWEARGSGWASDVTDEGWEGFEKNLKVARKILTEAWELHPEYPEAPTSMITVVMGGYGGPGETERMWFDRAVAAQMDYDPAYCALMIAMLPRWGGDLDELYDFGVECVQNGRYDTIVPMQFMTVLGQVSNPVDGDESYWLAPKTTQYLKTMFDGYVKDGGKIAPPEHFRAREALVAWSCYRYADAREILDKLGDKAQKSQFYVRTKDGHVDVREDICALGGDQGPELQRAMELEEDGKNTEALAIYEEVAPKVASDKLAAAYVKRKIGMLKGGAGQ